MRNWLSIALAVALAAFGIFEVSSNSNDVDVVLPFLTVNTKVWRVMLASAVVGAVVALLLTSWPLVRLKLQSRRHTRRIAQLEQEIHGLRTLPIASDAPAPQSVQKL